jgi:hypothetical protein
MNRLVLPFAFLALAGCVHHDFIPGPGAANPNTQMVSGQCKLVAIGAQPEGEFFAAEGSPKFVAAATAGHVIGSAIGSAVRTNATFNACMEANGYIDAPPAPGG